MVEWHAALPARVLATPCCRGRSQRGNRALGASRRPHAQPEAASSAVQAQAGITEAAPAASTPPHVQPASYLDLASLHAQPQQQQPQQEPEAATAVRSPVSVAAVDTLPAQSSLAAAVQALGSAVRAIPGRHSAHASGIVRLEVPLPRRSTPLCWLRGQQGPQQQAAGLLFPLIYFSPRRTTAPSTPGSEAAGAAAAGAGSVAGAGAAWLWKGAPGEPLTAEVTAEMQRFLPPASPRLRAFGGSRFNPGQQPAPEWREFGSYCFLIPRLELTEASGCHLLACTVAWDAAHSPEATGGSSALRGPSAALVGFASMEAAVMDALAALEAMQPPAPPAAGRFKLQRQTVQHVPEREGWSELMGDVHASLQPAGQLGPSAGHGAAAALAGSATGGGEGAAAGGDACAPLLNVNPETAREEYLFNGQEGLDDLLAAMDGGFEVGCCCCCCCPFAGCHSCGRCGCTVLCLRDWLGSVKATGFTAAVASCISAAWDWLSARAGPPGALGSSMHKRQRC